MADEPDDKPKEPAEEIIVAEKGEEPGETPTESKPKTESENKWQDSAEFKNLSDQLQKLQVKSDATDAEIQRLQAELSEKKRKFFRKPKSKRRTRRQA